MRVVFKLFCLLIFLAPISSRAQLDSSFNTTYYQQKVSQYRLFKPKHEKRKPVMFIGDSITDIAEWSELFGTIQVLNRGISADNTFGVLNRLDDVRLRKPSKLFIMIGINDISHSIPDEKILANYWRIIETVRKDSPKTSIYVQSILPTNNAFSEFKRHQNKDEHIRKINKALEEGSKSYSYQFVNLYPLFLNTEGKLDTKYSNDGLHLTAAGYEVWKNYLLKLKYL
ncbi:GDSL-type esterase/lipase family protein [Desertivirga brevis]|uniref:GDSL-type esterase/lipase family protein n=1 Tax=Desertivirga brevis TaxID=2810310 RepID=UPI001A95A041|nr:GDSL-type esterase/lipase family protein [Pedobacter sp. SYSU D00873]